MHYWINGWVLKLKAGSFYSYGLKIKKCLVSCTSTLFFIVTTVMSNRIIVMLTVVIIIIIIIIIIITVGLLFVYYKRNTKSTFFQDISSSKSVQRLVQFFWLHVSCQPSWSLLFIHVEIVRKTWLPLFSMFLIRNNIVVVIIVITVIVQSSLPLVTMICCFSNHRPRQSQLRVLSIDIWIH